MQWECAFPPSNCKHRQPTAAGTQGPGTNMRSETKTPRITMKGNSGRMGYRQHLLRSILPIRDAGGFTLENGTKVQVEPILVGRNETKIRELAEKHKVAEWSTDLDAVINDPTVDVVFDASMTS